VALPVNSAMTQQKQKIFNTPERSQLNFSGYRRCDMYAVSVSVKYLSAAICCADPERLLIIMLYTPGREWHNQLRCETGVYCSAEINNQQVI